MAPRAKSAAVTLQQTQPMLDASIIEKAVVQGRLEHLTPAERLSYYNALCESLGVNPLTRPFEYVELNGKLTLYARRDLTDQLRAQRNVSVMIVSRERIDDIYVVTARATMPDGRVDESQGAVALTKQEMRWDEVKRRYVPTGNTVPLKGDELANAIMKAETKAKRRVTLSICGLGIIDETEIETVPGARVVDISGTSHSTKDVSTTTSNKIEATNNSEVDEIEKTAGDAYEEELDAELYDECTTLYLRLPVERRTKFDQWLFTNYKKKETYELTNDELREVVETLRKATRTTIVEVER